jgi:AraC-like DNA-binding protein
MGGIELHDVAFHALALLGAAEQAGVPREDLLAETGVDPAILDPPHGIVAYAHVGRLIEAAVARTGDPCIGLRMPEAAPHTAMGALYFELASIDTAGDALRISYEMLADFSNLLRVRIESEGGLTRVHYAETRRDAPGLAQMLQFHLANFTRNFRLMVSADYNPRAVYLRHAAPPDPTPYRELFRCPVHFGAPASLVELDSAVLAHPMRLANPELRKAIAPLIEALRAGLPGSDAVVRAIRDEIAPHLGAGRLTLARIAARLGVPARTLQHRLQHAGTGFQQLVDEARAARATTLLADPRYTVSDIAFRLGYGSTAAFHRAFRRWTGHTPWQYRERHPPAPARGSVGAPPA